MSRIIRSPPVLVATMKT